jgi:hypothetical protein
MTLGEKSAALAGPDQSKCSDGIYSFSEVLDSACEKLMDRQIKYSIRRIREMEERLCCLERELDDFLFQKGRKLR